MNSRVFTAEQKAKLTQIINEGMQVMHEIETLNGGLTDTIKAMAEEMEIKPAMLKKAIRIAHKAEFGKEQQDHELLEQILTSQGHFIIIGIGAGHARKIFRLVKYDFCCGIGFGSLEKTITRGTIQQATGFFHQQSIKQIEYVTHCVFPRNIIYL